MTQNPALVYFGSTASMVTFGSVMQIALVYQSESPSGKEEHAPGGMRAWEVPGRRPTSFMGDAACAGQSA